MCTSCPKLFVWAAVGAASAVRLPVARAVWLLAPIVVLAMPKLGDPLRWIVPVGNNGDPFEQVVVAAELKRNASPDANLGVITAGIVPYFTRLTTIDFLGKTDPYVARVAPVAGAKVGRQRSDYSFALSRLRDLEPAARLCGRPQVVRRRCRLCRVCSPSPGSIGWK